MTLQRCEDMRMNVLCRAQGLDQAMDAPMVTDTAIWDRLLVDTRSSLTAGISTFDTGDFLGYSERSATTEYFFKTYGPEKTFAEIEEFIAGLYSALRANPTFEQTIRNAQATEAFLRGEDPDDSESGEGDESEDSEGDSESEGNSSGSESADDESDDSADSSADSSAGDGETDTEDYVEYSLDGTDAMDAAVDAMLQKDAAREAMTPFEQGLETLGERKAQWGRGKKAVIVPVKVTEQKMPKRLPPSKFKSRQKVPADRGMVPKHMHRYCTDKAIFAGRGSKRSRGGTILIDASGSMRIGEDQIDAIMESCPLGTIASYSGVGGSTGDLYVIAKNGSRAISNLRPPGMMNYVDVPALEWMVKHDGPYYWVCDGGVSGANSRYTTEIFGENIYDRCIELVEQHGIIMVPTLDRLVEVINGK